MTISRRHLFRRALQIAPALILPELILPRRKLFAVGWTKTEPELHAFIAKSGKLAIFGSPNYVDADDLRRMREQWIEAKNPLRERRTAVLETRDPWTDDSEDWPQSFNIGSDEHLLSIAGAVEKLIGGNKLARKD
jgi:hypothetical protein